MAATQWPPKMRRSTHALLTSQPPVFRPPSCSLVRPPLCFAQSIGLSAQNIVNGTLPAGIRRFDQCRIPLAVSAFDVSRLTTRTLEEGCIAQALRATCTFPGLFAPVWHEKGVLVDGGIRDTTGTPSCVSLGLSVPFSVFPCSFGARCCCLHVGLIQLGVHPSKVSPWRVASRRSAGVAALARC